MAFVQRFDYCKGCAWWRYFGGFYGCFKFKVYRFDEFDSLCGGRCHTSGLLAVPQEINVSRNLASNQGYKVSRNQQTLQSSKQSSNQGCKKSFGGYGNQSKGRNDDQYRARRSEELSQRAGADRFVIVDTLTGEVVDKANGNGYHTMPAAYKGWGYKQKLRRKQTSYQEIK